MKRTLLATLLTILPLFAAAQTGTLTGQIVDETTAEPMIGVNVYLPDVGTGAVTDLDGTYRIDLEPGTYTLEVSYITHQKKIVTDVSVTDGTATKLDLSLSEANQELEEVVVSARRIDNNEVALLRLQKRSLPVQDGISAQEIARLGLGNSAESMKMVTGASVEDGKYIVMRGLGDRYSISSLDGMALPATNPYRNSASLDLIPSSMVDNIVVKKTFSPDLPGNFTGGAVDISTKSLPDRYYLDMSTSVSYNDQTTLNSGFRRDAMDNRYRRFGADDGSRAYRSDWQSNPHLTNLSQTMIQLQNNQLSQEEIQAFNSSMRSLADRSYTTRAVQPEPNHGLNLSYGNRHELGNSGDQIGYNLGFHYDKSYSHDDQRQINNYSARIPDGSQTRMRPFQLNSGSESQDNVQAGYIGALTWQPNTYHDLTVTSIFNNSGNESVLDMNNGAYPGALSSGSYNNRVISFTQRRLMNNQIKGRHSLDPLEIRWSVNRVLSTQYEPDTRFLGAPVDNQGSYFFVREVQLPFHFFRDLEDRQSNAKLDLEYQLNDRLTLKTGGLFSRKDRTFDEQRIQLENNGTDPSNEEFLGFREASGDYDSYFSASNMGVLGTDGNGQPILGLTWRDQTRPENSYSGEEQIAAGFLMGVVELSDQIRIFGGARLEKTDFTVQPGSGAAPGTLDVVDILPSLNLIYSLNEATNLRWSASQTLARPTMREMAPFASFDLLGGFPIVGNPGLTRTNVTNLDMRYELFPTAGELFAVSGFYKQFENPIVLELDVATDQPQYSYVNTDSGRLYGLEFEFRKHLGFLHSRLENLKFSSNVTWTYSKVDMSDQEYQTRRQLDEDIQPYRPFPHQSPYIINATLQYEHGPAGLDAALHANLFGPRLAANGSGAAPDIYEVYGKTNREGQIDSVRPMPDLGLRIKKSFLPELSVALNLQNLLDYSVVQYQKDGDTYFTNSAINPGRTVSLSVSYSIR
ncbi:MAG: TonB-dependent receptor domain-containing protein [Bacteroidota bacterium]